MAKINILNRSSTIDLLRGLSILAVILLHINIRIPLEKSFFGQFIPPSIAKILLWSGYYGVVVFFVISGFLITLGAIRRWGDLQNIPLGQFYSLRIARIMPSLIGLLIILSILDLANIKGFVIAPHQTSLAHILFSALTFHLNWLEAKVGYLPGGWDVLWSLSVEETFYFFFPLICRMTKNQLNFILVMSIFIIIGPFARTVFSNNDIWMDHSYFSCMDGIALGCLAALLISKVKFRHKQQTVVFFLGICFTLFIFVFRKTVAEFGLTRTGLNVTILELGIALLIVGVHERSEYHSLRQNWLSILLQWYGRNSYEIYLTHTFFVLFFTKFFYATHYSFNFVPLYYFAIIGISGYVGQLIAYYYAEPLNKILRGKYLLLNDHHVDLVA